MRLNTLTIPEKLFGVNTNMMTVFIPLVGIIIVAVVGYNIFLAPKIDDISKMQSDLKSVETKSKSVLEKTRYLQSIDPEELKKNSDFISNALLPQQNAYLLVSVVRSVADKFGFQVESFLISPGKLEKVVTEVKKSGKNIPRIPISVSLVGPKNSFLDLIKGLERNLPVLSVDSFKMTNIGTMAKLDLEISAFYLEDNNTYDINKLTLSDLTLLKEETDLVTTLGEYSISLDVNAKDNSGTNKVYRKYDRIDPFSL